MKQCACVPALYLCCCRYSVPRTCGCWLYVCATVQTESCVTLSTAGGDHPAFEGCPPAVSPSGALSRRCHLPGHRGAADGGGGPGPWEGAGGCGPGGPRSRECCRSLAEGRCCEEPRVIPGRSRVVVLTLEKAEPGRGKCRVQGERFCLSADIEMGRSLASFCPVAASGFTAFVPRGWLWKGRSSRRHSRVLLCSRRPELVQSIFSVRDTNVGGPRARGTRGMSVPPQQA